VTIQRRVLGYLALAVLACSLLTVGIAVVLVRDRVAAQRLDALEAQADTLALLGGVPGALAPGVHVFALGNGHPHPLGPLRRAAVLGALPGSSSGQGTLDVAGHSLLYAARPTSDGLVVLVRQAALSFAAWRPFLWSVVLAGLGGGLVALLLSYLLSRRLSRPIARLAAAIGRLTAGQDSVTVAIEGDDELAQLGRSFNQMARELARARQAQREFLESVSHELKTPLTSIRGYAEALEEGAVPAAESAGVIATEADRLERLVDDLLELARFGRAGFSVRREPFELAQIAAQVTRRHAPQARELGIELRDETPDPSRTTALGDHARLLQAASNLVENALRVTPAGGEVLVRAEPGELLVSDTGPGLAEEDLQHAFERFYLYRRYRSQRPVGSGLGLAIVRELVEAMGGSVAAAQRGGGGTEFCISLPVAEARAHEPAAAPQASTREPAAAPEASTPARSAPPDGGQPCA
jgi:signal transduction histidine kinase